MGTLALNEGVGVSHGHRIKIAVFFRAKSGWRKLTVCLFGGLNGRKGLGFRSF